MSASTGEQSDSTQDGQGRDRAVCPCRVPCHCPPTICKISPGSSRATLNVSYSKKMMVGLLSEGKSLDLATSVRIPHTHCQFGLRLGTVLFPLGELGHFQHHSSAQGCQSQVSAALPFPRGYLMAQDACSTSSFSSGFQAEEEQWAS